jgi:serine/threonine protein kinase
VYNPPKGDPTDTRIGTELAGYKIESLIARGGMGDVYLASQTFPERRVALKILSSELASDPAFRDRFIRESNAAASTEHPNIIPVFGAGQADDVFYIVMRYVEGTDLRSLIDREGSLPFDRAVSIVSQVAEALDAAHELGLVHRDVKPGNILLAKASGGKDHAYLTDFGLIRRSDVRTNLTKTGQFMGTIDYCAPEQIRGDPIDGRADVYSLGCVLYECVVGEPPFRRDTEVATLYAHLEQDPPGVTNHRRELPQELNRVIAKAMAKRPGARYETAGELAQAARSAAPAEPTRLIGRFRTRRRALIGALALGLLAIPVIGGILVWRSEPEAMPTAPDAAPAPNSVVEIDASSGQVSREIPGLAGRGGSVSSKVAVGEGGIWSLQGGVNLLCIDQKTASVAGSLYVGDGADLVVASRTVWIPVHGTFGADGRVTRVNPATCKLLPSIGVPGDATAGAAGEGAVWVTTSDGLVRVDPRTNRTQLYPIDAGTDDVAVGEGAVWVLDILRGIVTRVDPATGEQDQIQLSGTLDKIVAGEGKIWVLDSGAGTVTPIGPDSGRPLSPIRVGAEPLDIAVGPGSVYVSNADGTLSRIDPVRLDASPLDVGAPLASIAVEPESGNLWGVVFATPPVSN